MIYRALGLMSGSSLDGLDMAFVEFHEAGGKWTFELKQADCLPYSKEWEVKLAQATKLNAGEYLLLHTEYGRYIASQVKHFIEKYELDYQVQLISSHGHTTFHFPEQHTTGQLGDGASIAALTGIATVTDLRAVDMALGGQGAPIVPIGERLLWPGYPILLNLGGIANVSIQSNDKHVAFDICPANKVLNLLIQETGKAYDDGGSLAAQGTVNEPLLSALNALDYYSKPYPKSLANDFGIEIVYPLVKNAGLTLPDALATYVEHIAVQLKQALLSFKSEEPISMLITGGGAHHRYMGSRINYHLASLNITAEIPDASIINYKEAIVMALMGVLRWREEVNVYSAVTGAERNSVGGALWITT